MLIIGAPATARADLRSPVFGETLLLSDVPNSRSYVHDAATDGKITIVTWAEDRGGVSVHRLGANGSDLGTARVLQGLNTISTSDPRVAISGSEAHVVWAQPGKVMVASSHDGGLSWSEPRVAGTSGYVADPRIAVDGQNVFVIWRDELRRVRTAGSRDGGRTWPCQARISEQGEAVSSDAYDVAVAGDRVHWIWASSTGTIVTRRSLDAGRTVKPTFAIAELRRAGYPRMEANAGRVVAAFGDNASAAISTDAGASFAVSALASAATQCTGDYCTDPHGLALDGTHAYVTWRGGGSVWLARSTGGGFGPPQAIGPIAFAGNSQYTPQVSANAGSVAVAWHVANPSGEDPYDHDPVAAHSSDRGATFQMQTVDDGGKDFIPLAVAYGPDPVGAGFAWLRIPVEGFYFGDLDIHFRALAAAEPDVALLEVTPTQGPRQSLPLISGRPTAVRVTLRSGAPVKMRLPIRVTVDGAHHDQDLVVPPGTTTTTLRLDDPLVPDAGPLSVAVEIDPEHELADMDRSNDRMVASRTVRAGRDFTVLFVPVAADDEGQVACRDVADVADGAQEHLLAAWPLDPSVAQFLEVCSAGMRHAPGLDEDGLMKLLGRLDRLTYAGPGIDKVVGVVPQGWFSRQAIPGAAGALGIAPLGGSVDAVLVERQNTGGWVVGHELAHQLGREHATGVKAPGLWVAERREIAQATLDFLHPSTEGASVEDPAGRWTSTDTWAFLADALNGAAPATGNVITVSGDEDGLEPAFLQTGTPDPEGGDLTVEQRDADGNLLASRSVATSGEVTGLDGTPAAVDSAPFAARVPAAPGAKQLRVLRGTEVLGERTRSAGMPVVELADPASARIGQDLTLDWTASDPDGDALTARVDISVDGTDWTPLTETKTARMTSAFAGPAVRVRVTVTDGWNTATDTSAPFPVTGGLGDGRIAFSAEHSAYGHQTRGLWTVDLDGSDLTHINPAAMIRPRWSPDNTKLAYDNIDAVFVSDADGSDQRTVIPRYESGAYAIRPYWRPDGERIYAHKFETWGGSGGVSVDADGGDEQPFPLRAVGDFTADGERMVAGDHFQSTARADGTEIRAVPGGPYGERVSLSPDGGRLVAAKDNNVSIYDTATGALVKNLTAGGWTNVEHPNWTPSGEWIVFGASQNGEPGLWRIRPDGTGAALIVGYGSLHATPRYPDVQAIQSAPPAEEPEPGPEAEAGGPYAAVEGAPVTLQGAGDWDSNADGIYADAETITFPDEGSYTVAVRVTDADGRAATDTATVEVANAAPAIAGTTVTTEALAVLAADVTDPGADALSARVDWGDGSIENIAIDGSRLVATHRFPTAGARAVRVTVTDGDGGSAAATAVAEAPPVNGVPAAGDASAATDAGTPVVVELPASDPDGEGLTVEILSAPESGSVDVPPLGRRAAPRLTYLPGASGTFELTYRVTDGRDASQSRTVKLEVRPPAGESPAGERSGPPPPPAAPPAQRPSVSGSRPDLAVRAVDAAPFAKLPSARKCASRRNFRITLAKGVRSARAWVNGKRVKSQGRSARIDLRGLPKGSVRVRIELTLSDGRKATLTRTYRTCTKTTKSPKGGRK